MPKYLVETISSFLIRYVVDCEHPDHAADEVTMEEVGEFSQNHVAENITSVREISDDEVSRLFFEDHPYLTEHGPEKAHSFVHKVKYDV
jgi:hypothetical protein